MYRSSSAEDIKSKIINMQDNLALLKVLEDGSHHFKFNDMENDRFFNIKEYGQQQFKKIVDTSNWYGSTEKERQIEILKDNIETIKCLEMFEARSCMERLLLALSEEEINDLIQSPEIFSQICDFMHLHLDMQELATNKSKLQYVEDCKKSLSSILGKLKGNISWCDHFVRDLQTRMIKTIVALDAKDYGEGSYTAEGQLVDLIRSGDLQTCLEPVCLIFFSNQILEHNYLRGNQLMMFIVSMFDVCLYYTLLQTVNHCKNSMQGIDLLHDGCLKAIRSIAQECEHQISEGQKLSES